MLGPVREGERETAAGQWWSGRATSGADEKSLETKFLQSRKNNFQTSGNKK